MNDADIIKALECCSHPNMCHECPCHNKRTCWDMKQDAIYLIKRQKAEIEKLKDDNQYLEDRRWKELCAVRSETIKDVLLQLEAEIESSEKYMMEYDDGPLQKAYNQGLRDAYKAVKGMTDETL